MMAGNLFNATGQGILGSVAATEQDKTANEVTPVKAAAWYNSPLMFIGVVVSLLVIVRFVERKVD
jgi:hypothetical protein